MAKRVGLGLALPVALVALVFGQSGCGGGGSGSGTGGAGGKAGHAGSGGAHLGGASGGGISGGGVSGEGGTCADFACGGVDGGGTGGSIDGSTGGHAGTGGQAGGGAGGHQTTDGGHDAAMDGGATDAHHGDAATDAHADGATDAGPIACTNACVLGSHRCGGGGSQTCVMGGDGCTVWGTAAPCLGATTCATGTGICVCPAAPAGCTAVGTFCNGAGEVVACARDTQGCFSASAPHTCPSNQSCKGSAPNAACACDNDPSCHGGNGYCLNASTVASCGSDGSPAACNVVVSTHACGGSSSCVDGACVCPAAGTTAGTGCSTVNATRCAGTDILTCVTESGSGCNLWQALTHCGSNALTCGTKAGAGPACQCAENSGTDVFVDPVAGSDMPAGLFPTGVQNPPACRFATLTKALGAAGSPGRVVAVSATLPATFAGETFPLAIPAGVSLITADATFNASDYKIAYRGGASTAVTLGAGSALRGFSVESSGTASALVSCAGGAVTLDTVLLAGAGVVTDGLDITSSCSATLQSVSIVDFAADSLNVSTSGTVAITGGLLSASQVGLVQTSGSVTASGLAVESNGQYGIRLPFNSNNPSLTITGQSLVENNGTTGDFAGIAVTKGTLSVTSTQLAGNGGAGIAIASAGAHTLANVQLTGNGTKGTEPGLWISSGTLTASGVSASGNSGDGVTASGGSSSFTGATLSSNKGNGLGCASSCTFDLSGGTIQNNTKAGISGGLTGTLTVHGGTEITGNATGVQLTGAVTTIAGANIHGNSGPGVSVDHNAGSTIGIGSPTTTTTIAGNQQQGIVVPAASPVPGSGANSLTIDSATITGNGSFGIYLQASDGTVAATVKANTITGNADTGLMVEEGVGQTTVVAVQNNDVSGNNVKTSPRNVGGVLFNTSARLTSFIGNKVHSNGGDELGFNGLPDGGGTKWTITPPSNACDTTANSIYCYGTGNVGIHVLAAGASVDAQHQHWTNNPPTVGIDYTGTVTVTNPCTAITTCP